MRSLTSVLALTLILSQILTPLAGATEGQVLRDLKRLEVLVETQGVVFQSESQGGVHQVHIQIPANEGMPAEELVIRGGQKAGSFEIVSYNALHNKVGQASMEISGDESIEEAQQELNDASGRLVWKPSEKARGLVNAAITVGMSIFLQGCDEGSAAGAVAGIVLFVFLGACLASDWANGRL